MHLNYASTCMKSKDFELPFPMNEIVTVKKQNLNSKYNLELHRNEHSDWTDCVSIIQRYLVLHFSLRCSNSVFRSRNGDLRSDGLWWSYSGNQKSTAALLEKMKEEVNLGWRKKQKNPVGIYYWFLWHVIIASLACN